MEHSLTGKRKAVPCILIVDDLPELRRAVARFLRARGYTVVEADGGANALEIIRAQVFDVVVTDVMMPEVSGVDLLCAVRRELRPLPVILMSALPTRSTAVRAREGGAFAYLAKPFEPQLLEATIARAVEVHRATRHVIEDVSSAPEVSTAQLQGECALSRQSSDRAASAARPCVDDTETQGIQPPM